MPKHRWWEFPYYGLTTYGVARFTNLWGGEPAPPWVTNLVTYHVGVYASLSLATGLMVALMIRNSAKLNPDPLWFRIVTAVAIGSQSIMFAALGRFDFAALLLVGRLVHHVLDGLAEAQRAVGGTRGGGEGDS